MADHASPQQTVEEYNEAKAKNWLPTAPMADIDAKAKELAERLDSHMGKAKMAEVLRDCRLAAALILSQAETIAEQDLLYKALADLSEHNYRMALNRAEAAEAEVERLREALRDYLFAEEIDDPDVRQGELAVARHAAAATLSASKEP